MMIISSCRNGLLRTFSLHHHHSAPTTAAAAAYTTTLQDIATNHKPGLRLSLHLQFRVYCQSCLKRKTQLFRDGSPMVYSGGRIIGRPPPKTGDIVLVADGTEKPIGWVKALGLPSAHTNAYPSCKRRQKYRQEIESYISRINEIKYIKWRPSADILKRRRVMENGISYSISLEGQKTGFYADQRENRKFLSSISEEDASAFMKGAASRHESWDLVILDPPKLAPNKKGAAAMAGKKVTVLRQAGAACDHPIDPSYPEGTYLSNILLRVL
ncbi:hypothetical protein MKW92_052054 [Papaver armeniacum]|nr:hypothetical protein MKW92_052054 [Papaver armeniacum]